MKTKVTIFLLLVLLYADSYAQSASEIADLNRQIKNEENAIKKLQSEKASTTKQLAAIKQKQDTYKRLLSTLNTSISDSDKKLKTIQQDVKKTEQIIDKLRREAIKSNIFVIDNLGYSSLKIITSAKPQGDAIKTVELLSVATGQMSEKTIELKQHTERLNILKADEVAKLDELKTLKADRVSALDELNEDNKRYNSVLKVIQNDEKGRREYLEMLEFRRKELDNEISNSAGSVTTTNPDFERNKGKYPWAITGTVIENYGENFAEGTKFRVLSKGIKIKPSMTSPAKAIADGTVVYAGYMRGFDYVVVLSHGSPYYTIYANMSSVFVNEGDIVSQLDTVGYVSVGEGFVDPHLYFEVRRNEQALNPRQWLVR